MKKFILISALALQLLVHSASAGPIALVKLKKRLTRPTMTELIAAVGLHPDPTVHKAAIDSNEATNWAQDLKTLPKTIAYMEYLFPNAIWAPLGRDAVILGDLLDAFYTAIGQPGRVSRLNGSGGTIRSVDPVSLLRFMQDAGVSFGADARPFVAFDRTQYQENSQSRQLMNAVYDGYARQGGRREDLVRRINFLGLSRDLTPRTQKSAQDYFSSVQVERSIDRIIQVPVGSWMDSPPWHESFDALTVQANKKLEGLPGSLSPEPTRQHILDTMIWILHRATSEDFISEVAYEATVLGYELPIRSSVSVDIEKVRIRIEKEVRDKKRQALLEKKKKIQGHLASLNETINYFTREKLSVDTEPGFKNELSPLLWPLSAWLNRVSGVEDRNILALHFISEITAAYRKQVIGKKDFLILVETALIIVDIEPTFFKRIAKICEAEPLLSQAFIEDEVYFFRTDKYGQRSEREQVREIVEAIRTRVLKNPVDPEKIRRDEVAAATAKIDHLLKDDFDQIPRRVMSLSALPKGDSLLSELRRINRNTATRWDLMERNINNIRAWADQLKRSIDQYARNVELPDDFPGAPKNYLSQLYWITAGLEALKVEKVSSLAYSQFVRDAFDRLPRDFDSGLFTDLKKLAQKEPLLARTLIDNEKVFTKRKLLNECSERAADIYETVRELSLDCPVENSKDCSDLFGGR